MGSKLRQKALQSSRGLWTPADSQARVRRNITVNYRTKAFLLQDNPRTHLTWVMMDTIATLLQVSRQLYMREVSSNMTHPPVSDGQGDVCTIAYMGSSKVYEHERGFEDSSSMYKVPPTSPFGCLRAAFRQSCRCNSVCALCHSNFFHPRFAKGLEYERQRSP